MYDPGTGILLRRYRQGDAAIPGFLDDYAFFAQALLDLYETNSTGAIWNWRIRLTEKQRSCSKTAHGAFLQHGGGRPRW
jgi:uncharacterized protein